MISKDKCFVIAEIGVNHNGDVDLAHKMIALAADTGADAVKFQTFFAEELVTETAQKADYQLATTDRAQSQFDMLQSLELTEEEFVELNGHCQESGIEFLSTPFSHRAVDLLEKVGVGAFKVSSGDLTYLQMLDYMARKGKPIILSSGMATLAEIEDAVQTIEVAGNDQISILHCVSNYPAAAEDCNLAAMATIRDAFGYPVGWSDHTIGAPASLAAVALGASIIEKHITLDKTMTGPDHSASMEPEQFRNFVADIRDVERAVGSTLKRPTSAELKTAQAARRSLTVSANLKKGHRLTAQDISILRPGTGLAPKLLPLIIGQIINADLPSGTPLEARYFDPSDK